MRNWAFAYQGPEGKSTEQFYKKETSSFSEGESLGASGGLWPPARCWLLSHTLILLRTGFLTPPVSLLR